MINFVVLGLLAIFTIYYVYFITCVRIGLLSLKPGMRKNYFPMVTVVVAARNEEIFIGQCLQTLALQTYPFDKYEIIIVDDGSTDNTASIVKAFSEKYRNIKFISLSSNYGNKSMAISKGIENANGEIILTTDADCKVQNRWIEIMSNHFEDDVALVAGPVIEHNSKTFLSRLMQLEFLGLITTAAGLIGSGRPIICNGANLGYRKTVFDRIGGYTDNISSNDDEYLMNKILNENIGKIIFSPEADGVVATESLHTIKSFLLQRIRWAKKRGHYKNKSIFIALFSLYMFFLCITLTASLIVTETIILLPFLISITGKIFVDYFTLHAGAKLFRQNISIFYFLIAELLHVPYIVIIAAISQLVPIQWKDRKVKR